MNIFFSKKLQITVAYISGILHCLYTSGLDNVQGQLHWRQKWPYNATWQNLLYNTPFILPLIQFQWRDDVTQIFEIEV